MSHPEDPAPGAPTPDPTPDAPTPDAQPTAAYPPPPADAPPAPPQYAQPPQPSPYTQQPGGYAQPGAYTPVTPPPAGPDGRPKTLGWVSLGLAILGIALVSVAFIPMLWVSLVLTLVGGLILLVALVLGIVTLANKKQGGKGLGIGAIIVSVIGGGAWVGAIIWSIVIIGLGTAEWSTDSEGVPPGVEQSDGGSATADGEEAFLADVRPELLTLFQEIDPAITVEQMETAFPEEALLSMGEGSLVAGDAGREAMVEALTQSTGGAFTTEQATRFYDVVYSAAQEHLAE